MSELPGIYLAGPMAGLTWEEAAAWRAKATTKLRHYYRVYTPVKPVVAEKLSDETIPAFAKDEAGHVHITRTASAIFAKDRYYIDQSEWILGNFTGTEEKSVGTIWEYGYAYALGKKIVSVLQNGSCHDHAFIRQGSHVFVPTLDEALDYLVDVAK